MISQVKVSERSKASRVVVLHCSKDKLTLEQLKLCDGDKLAAEASTKKGIKTLAHSVADRQNNLLSVIVEDRCSPHLSDSTSYPVHAMEVVRDSLISTFKSAILLQLQLSNIEGGGRLRLDDECPGPPLHEEQTLDQVGVVQGHCIILEPGPPPTPSQLVLRCRLSSGTKEWEVTVDEGATVAECCQLVVLSAGLQGNQWHLRRTNWCGEATEVLDDETSVLSKENLKSGDLLLIEEGKLPPKNFVRLAVSLFTPSYPTCTPAYLTDPDLTSGLLSWVMDSATVGVDINEQGFTHDGDFPRVDPNEVPLHLQSPAQFYPGLPGCLVGLDSIEIHRDSTIEELKALILTLPALGGAVIPTLDFLLRVREMVNGRLGKVFKNPQQTLRRNKMETGSHVCVTVLEQEETLPATAIVVHIQARTPGRRSYGPAAEVIYDCNRSTKPAELVKLVSRLVQIDVSHLRVAKHKLESFEWIVLQENYNKESRKKKKSKSTAANIKNSPICLRDGDTLGLKNLQYDPEDADDFSTESDDRGKEILTAVQEEKRRKRKLKSTDLLDERGGANQRPRRTEVGIKIFVPDYKRSS
ncbi:Ubiquitin carboxyl-terminal hydrolase 40 [Geodia barretti]|nr:Ubiquitin carboxyl-terminal hydrolase 40 [Geodia barretti]